MTGFRSVEGQSLLPTLQSRCAFTNMTHKTTRNVRPIFRRINRVNDENNNRDEGVAAMHPENFFDDISMSRRPKLQHLPITYYHPKTTTPYDRHETPDTGGKRHRVVQCFTSSSSSALHSTLGYIRLQQSQFKFQLEPSVAQAHFMTFDQRLRFILKLRLGKKNKNLSLYLPFLFFTCLCLLTSSVDFEHELLSKNESASLFINQTGVLLELYN